MRRCVLNCILNKMLCVLNNDSVTAIARNSQSINISYLFVKNLEKKFVSPKVFLTHIVITSSTTHMLVRIGHFHAKQ